jgi:uncharacterized protein YcnI
MAGSDTVLTFAVPSESETADTTALTVTFPQDHPFASVAARSMPGWTVKVTEAELPTPVQVAGTTLTTAVRTVTWTAKPGSAIAPAQYENFEVKVGPLPESGEIGFVAGQTYSDGSVVAWDEPETAGAAEPEHPAPSFAVTPAVVEPEAPAEAEVAAAPVDSFTRWTAVAGLVAGLAALGLIVARRSPRRPQSSPITGELTADLPSEPVSLPSA